MYKDAFTKRDTLEVETILAEINPLIDGSPYKPEQTVILSLDLSFYPGSSLLEIADHTMMPPRKTQIVYKPGAVTLLDWTNAPLYRLNETVPITLDENTVVDYVRFFFTVVRGRHGRFLIVESVDDIFWRDEPPVAARKAIGALIEPLRLIAIDPDGSFLLSSRMMFKDSLFKSNIRVSGQGLVTLQDEELVVEDIPIRDDIAG